MIKKLSIAVLVWSGFMVAVLGGATVAEQLYDGAVADCAQHGGTPAAVENRLAYVCVTPEGMMISP